MLKPQYAIMAPMPEPGIKFLCDDMLGKLARWLRIIGQDVFYQNRIPDQELIETALSQSRLVLTRDLKLAKNLEHKNMPRYLVLENYPAHQLKEVVEKFADKITIRVFSRCVDCNVPLLEVSKDQVQDKVPPFVFKTQNYFRRCPSCGRVFWSGTHRMHVEEQLRYVLGEIYDKLKEEVWPPLNAG